jgi:hypothetical protein
MEKRLPFSKKMLLQQSFDLPGRAIFGFQGCPFSVARYSSHFLLLLFLPRALGSLLCVSLCEIDGRLKKPDAV